LKTSPGGRDVTTIIYVLYIQHYRRLNIALGGMLLSYSDIHDKTTGQEEEQSLSSWIEFDLDCDDEEITEINGDIEPVEALMRCLDECGRVDIKRISLLTGLDEKEVVERLGSAIIRNPEGWNGEFSEGFELREQYFSGNLAAKLKVLRRANEEYNGIFDDNIKALTSLLPKLGAEKKIKVSLGAPWVPADVIDDFIIHLLGSCIKHDYHTIYDKASNTWDIPYAKFYKNNVRNIALYGIPEMPAVKILERTLNAKNIEIMKSQPSWSKNKETVDHELTAMALEKRRMITAEFDRWVFADEDRAKRLREIYEVTFCSMSERRYDGSFLTFPGMTKDIVLRKNQRDAVARIVFNPNTLLAHDVGTGKTYTMIAAGQEIHRMGLSEKNMYVIPNSIFAQWEKDYRLLYPDANILVVDRRNFGVSKRQHTLEIMKYGKFDAILITASSFALIPMSAKARIEALRQKINELRLGQNDENARRRIIVKTIERLSSQIDKIYTEMADARMCGVEEGICFDHLGITTLFVDEAHEYKNITIQSKTKTVHGIVKKGSDKCNNMLAKVHYTQKNGRGAVFATATPISNSICDIFVMQTYLQFGEMKFLDLENFDNWSNTFAQREESLEIDVDSCSLKTITRLASFFNLQELSALITQVADFYTIDKSDAAAKCDVVDIKTSCSKSLSEYMQDISRRADLVRGGLVTRKEDNLLKITIDGKKAALDIRMIDEYCGEREATKVFRCAGQVYKIWEETMAEHLTQLVFCDISIPKSGQFSVYEQLKKELELKGIPQSEIAFIHDAETDSDKHQLFENVNCGKVRVLIGSTQKLGTGVNVQRKLCAIHHLDIPWKPSDMVQREGRMIRQGNECERVTVYRYVTKNSFDAYSWQLLEKKQEFISQFMTNTLGHDSDCGFEEMALSFAEIKALAIGNPVVRYRIEVQNDLNRMLSLQRTFINNRRKLNAEYEEMPMKISKQREHIDTLAADAAVVAAHPVPEREERRSMGEKLKKALMDNVMQPEESFFGTFRGLEILLPANMLAQEPRVILRGSGRRIIPMGEDIFGNIRRIENMTESLAEREVQARRTLREMLMLQEDMRLELARTNPYEEKIAMLRERLAEADKQLELKAAS